MLTDNEEDDGNNADNSNVSGNDGEDDGDACNSVFLTNDEAIIEETSLLSSTPRNVTETVDAAEGDADSLSRMPVTSDISSQQQTVIIGVRELLRART
jgi:hypothetical protein